MSFAAFVTSVLVGVGALIFAYRDSGLEIIVRGLPVVALFWIYACWRRWVWASMGGILLLVGLAGYGLWIALSPGWLVAGALGGLLAWDLSEFIRRLDVAPESEDLIGMQRRYLARLTLVAVVGLALTSIFMLLVRVEFTVEWVLLLVLVGVLGVLQLVSSRLG